VFFAIAGSFHSASLRYAAWDKVGALHGIKEERLRYATLELTGCFLSF